VIKNKKKDKNPFFNNLEAKIICIPEAIKERVLNLYLARQNIVHTIRFLQYMVVRRAEKLNPEAVSKQLNCLDLRDEEYFRDKSGTAA